MAEIHQGGCVCGDVRYRSIGKPVRTTVCHCSFCQRLTGSAFLVEPVFEAGRVVVEQGAPASYEHRSPSHGRHLQGLSRRQGRGRTIRHGGRNTRAGRQLASRQ